MDLKDHELEQLTLKFRNEERLKLWMSSLSKSTIAAAETDHLLSTQLSTPYTDCEDEEDCEDEYYDDEEDDFITQSRSRSSSINQQPIIRGKLGPSQSYDAAFKSSAVGRPYHNVPGMNLSPLPRSNSSLTNSSGISSPPNYDGYYPASPPPSYPSSPTSSTRISGASSNSSTWHRHDGKAFTEMAASFLAGYDQPEDYHHHLIQIQEEQHYQQHSLVHAGRSQSQSAALEASRSHTIRSTLPTNQNRLRSKSSPNIMKNSNQIPITASSSTATTANIEPVPQLPTRTFGSNKPAPLELKRQYNASTKTIRPAASTPRLTDIAVPPSPGSIKIKLLFNDGVYVITTNNEVTFFELMEKVDKKIHLVANLKPSDLLRLKYQDEDGDLITINSDDDVQMAFESRIQSTVILYVSL
jgi:cell division control protein 24